MLRKIASLVLSSVMALSCFTISPAFAEENNKSETNPVSKTIAFPGAEGGGMYATGVRGAIGSNEEMEVFHVTNLNDSGEGSFRDAVSKGNRIIVFDVSGYIDLTSNVTIGGENKKNITILGQTAPGDGICFRGNNIKVSGENVILRYLRFRVGDKLADGKQTKTQDGLEVVDDTKNVIIDHCSVSWGTDENLTAYAVKDVTIQNCIIAEALNQSLHSKGEHSYAAIWGGVNLSVHHNIIATHKSRNPKIGTSETTAMTAGYEDKDTLVDIRNNIIYNWGDKAGYGAENGAQVNIMNNWYKPGPATPENKRARIFEYSVGNKYQKNWSGMVHADGNYIDIDENDTALAKADAAKVNANNFQPGGTIGVYQDPKYPDMTYKDLTEPNTTYIGNYPITTTNAETAYNYVISNAGARLPKLDKVDERIIDNVINRTAPNGSKGSKGLVDSPIDGVPEADKNSYDDRGYPKFNVDTENGIVTRENTFDTDNDGIADAWEDKMGLDKTNPNDSLNIGPGGYTWLEIYVEEALTKAKNDITVTQTGLITANISDSSNLKTLEIYCGGEKIKEETVSSGESSYEISVEDVLPLGENYITVKAINNDGSYALSNTKVIHTAKEQYSGSKFENNSDGQNTMIFEDQGKFYMYADGENTGSLKKQNIKDDFLFVANNNYISNLLNGAQTGVSISSSSGKSVKLFRTYENNKIVLKKTDISGQTSTVADINAYSADMFKIEKTGDSIILQAGSSAAMLQNILNLSYSADFGSEELTVESYITGSGEQKTISEFNSLRYIDSTQKTSPKIEITNLKDNQRLNFSETVNVKVTPDPKANINEIAVFLGNNVIKNVFYENGINTEQEISIPIEFNSVADGDLRVLCFDENLGMSESKVSIVVSADISPWIVSNIGGTNTDMSSYVQGTTDYTYKIYAPEGNISGASDKYGYMYQEFNDDMRIYYRSRVQASKNFGIMLKDNLDSDGVSYFFGSEPCEPSVNEKGYTYSLKARTEKGGEYQTIKTFPDMKGDRYYIIAEKEGNKLKIYETLNSNTEIYKTKTLLAEVETTLGDNYYMGFAATAGVPDTGWLAVENIDNGNSESYKWNMNYGLDWYWQMQNSAQLAPSWTKKSIGGNDTGKMEISTGSDYIESFLMREYIINQGLVESGFDVFITGEKPSINFYLQTDLGSAYQVGFNDEKNITLGGEAITLGDETPKNLEYETSNWYKVKISAKVGETTAAISIYDNNGHLLAAKENVAASNFETVNNTEKTKSPIKQGFFIRPAAESQGTYYLDNMYVSLNGKGSLENAVAKAKTLKEEEYSAKTWFALKNALKTAEEVLAKENASEEEIVAAAVALENAISALKEVGAEIMGETKMWDFADKQFTDLGTKISGNHTFDELTLEMKNEATLEGNNKTFDDGTKLSYRLKAGTNHFKIKVNGKASIKVYAVKAGGDTRNLVITDGNNTQKYALGSETTMSEYVYNGSTPATIDIYGEAGLNYYGIKYTPYIKLEETTEIMAYNKESGIAQVYVNNESSDIQKAVIGIIVTDNDGKTLDIQKKEINVTKPSKVEEIEISTAKTGNIKVFLWDSLESMKPLCSAFEISQ